MTAPSSLSRILATLRRNSPPWPSTEPDTAVGKELNSFATGIGRAADRVDAVPDEIFPDSLTENIERWEKVTRNPVRTGDAIADRRTRVLSVLRRVAGPRLSQLATVLAGPLDLDEDEIEFVEMLRSYIEEALEETTGTVSFAVPTSAPGLTIDLGKPWPGVVDDFGVKVYVACSSFGTTVATLTSPAGTVWTVPVTASGWYQTRTTFEGERAGGSWRFEIRDSGGPTLTEFRLLVSNDVDSGQIYNFFVLRDPNLPGTPDLVEAQRLFRRTALGNMRTFVIERMAFTVGDEHSLVGRDPVGV